MAVSSAGAAAAADSVAELVATLQDSVSAAAAATAAASAAVPTSRTITVGAGLTGGGTLAANRTIGLETCSYVRAMAGADQTIARTTWTTVTMADATDAAGLWSTDVLTFNESGLWLIAAGVEFDASTTGSRFLRLTLNGTTLRGRTASGPTSSGLPCALVLTRQLVVSAGDALRVQAWHDHSASLALKYSDEQGSFLEATRVRVS